MTTSNILTLITILFVVAIDNKRIVKTMELNRLTEKSQKVKRNAKAVVSLLDLPSGNKMDISNTYLVTKQAEIWYDFIPLGTHGISSRLQMFPREKGISAAMLDANFQATIRTLFSYQRFDLDFLVAWTWIKKVSHFKGEKFHHFFQLIIDTRTVALMLHTILYYQRKESRNAEPGMLHDWEMLDELPFRQTRGKLPWKPNTTLVMYTEMQSPRRVPVSEN